MTDKVNPSNNRPADSFKTAGAIAYGGHGSSGFVVDSATPTDISKQDADIVSSELTAFSETSTDSSLDVTISGGEAFIFGSWVAKDTDSSVALTANTSDQTIYAGWDKNNANDVIVGLDSKFSDASGDSDKRIPLWTFNTDGSGVIAVTDLRQIGYSISVDGEVSLGSNDEVVLSYEPSEDELVVDGSDLSVGGVTVVDESNGYIPQSSLENTSVTIAGNSVDLGSSIDIDHNDINNLGSSDHHTRYSNEEAQDAVASALTGTGDIDVTYDDNGDTITVDASTLTNEQVEDIVSSLVSSDSNLSWGYDDNGDTLTISLSDSISVGILEAATGNFSNETLIKASGAPTSLSSGTWKTIDLFQRSDRREEFDSTTNQITVDRSGDYHIDMSTRFTSGSSGDNRRIRLRNVSTSSDITIFDGGSTDPFETLGTSTTVSLTTGDNYVFQAKNADSTDEVVGGFASTFISVRRVLS